MDPFSYGYNRATPAASYMTAETLVQTIVDIASKNGNLLLDVGPTGNGTIIDVEQQNLRAAGKWLKSHGEAIYNTTYWFITPEEGNVRFTQTTDAFYILSMEEPGSNLVLDSPVPYVVGDKVTVLGGNLDGVPVPTRVLSNGSLCLNLPHGVSTADKL